MGQGKGWTKIGKGCSADVSEKLEPEKVKDKPLCMASYKYL